MNPQELGTVQVCLITFVHFFVYIFTLATFYVDFMDIHSGLIVYTLSELYHTVYHISTCECNDDILAGIAVFDLLF